MAAEQKRITREDLEKRFRQVTGSATAEVDILKPRLLTAAVGAGLAVIAMAFLVGKRRGRRRSTIVEIRRA